MTNQPKEEPKGKAPAYQFYPSDWMRDLSEHSLEVEGAWIRINCALFFSETKGTADKTLAKWSRILRCGAKKSLRIIAYLDNHKIADVVNQNGSIRITSRRMVRDEYIRNIRRMAGCKGGNPALVSEERKSALDEVNLLKQKRTPSSSSSSSSSTRSKDTPPASPASVPAVKKSKKDYVFEGIPEWINEPEWNAYVEMRKKIRAPLTDWAMHLTVLDLETLMKLGHDPNKVLNQSTQKSWRGVFAITDDGQKSKGGKSFADQKRDQHDVAKRAAAKILGIRPSCSGEAGAHDSAGNNGSGDQGRLDSQVIEGVCVEDSETK